MHFEKELALLLLSRHLLIYIITCEEERLECCIGRVANSHYPCSIYSWNFIDGYQNNPNYFGQAKRNPLEALELIERLNSLTSKIFILKDFHLFLNDISIVRKIKNLSIKLKNNNSHIIITASEIQMSQLLREIITILEFPLPTLYDIKNELVRLFQVTSIGNLINIDSLAIAYKGMTMDVIRKSIAKLVSSQESIKRVSDIIVEEKKQLIQQTNILEFYPVNNTINDIGGLNNLKVWLHKRSNAFSSQAQAYGIPYPRGVLLVGIQGTGKSLSAKAISQQWSIPLLRLDIGKIFDGIVGESEKKMRKMIKIAEDSEPCVLWVDEMDKAFNRGNYDSDSGTTSRVLSSFLTWLSEKSKKVFVVATANNILNMPPEILRKGRFDEIFFLDLPSKYERCVIFKIHLMKVRPLTWTLYNIDHLSEITKNFSGAEIRQSIIEAMHNAFYERRDFTTGDIDLAIQELIPLAFTDASTISSLQNWARLGKVRLASD